MNSWLFSYLSKFTPRRTDQLCHQNNRSHRLSLANNPPAASIVPLLLFCSIPHEKRARLGLDAVVVLSERPGFIGQLVIGYGSGLSLIYDLHGDRVLALLPWQYGLESATWCGGSGLPIRHAADNPTVCPQQLGTRLLTAHADGSLGVWQIPIFDSVPGADHVDAQILSMKEAPSMPYGEIKRTLIINFCFRSRFIFLSHTLLCYPSIRLLVQE